RRSAKAPRAPKPGAALVAALSMASKVVETRTPNPVLAHVLVATDGAGNLRIAATDVADWFEATVPLDGVAWEGPAVAVDAAQMLALAKAGIASATVTGAPEAPKLEVRSRSGAMQTIPGQAAAEFPPRPETVYGEPCGFDAPALRRALDLVLPSVSADDNRYGLNGICVEAGRGLDEPRVRFLATDGNRLHLASAPLVSGSLAWPTKMLLRRKSGQRWAAMLKMGGATAARLATEAGPDPRSATLRIAAADGGEWRILSRLQDGDFPDYRRVLPTEYARGYRIDAMALAAALKDGLKVAIHCFCAVRFSFDAENETLRLSASAIDRGDWKAEVPLIVTQRPGVTTRMVRREDGAEVETPFLPSPSCSIGFNAKFVLDAIDLALATGDGFLRWEATADMLGPTRIAADGTDPETYGAFVMPVRLD
ncbi:MAG: DNA polymerase III subunit beta, partial [Myxococcota bacterium]|nr:DNA polymerase III subunit beta [Myxococcota bacterium]